MLLYYLSAFLIFAGVFFFTVGVVGLLRFPDVYTRLHATTKCDTLGAGLILVGLVLQSSPAVAVKLLLIVILLWIANPTAAHVIARAALCCEVPRAEGSFELKIEAGEEEAGNDYAP